MTGADAKQALVRLAHLEFERHAAALADVDACLRAAQAKLRDLDNPVDPPPVAGTLACLAASERWYAWRRDQRTTMLQAIAALRAEREGLATAAQRAFGRWQVLQRASNSAARRR